MLKVLVAFIAATFSTVATTAAASGEPGPKHVIRPGVQVFTNGGQCTANFVFTDGASLYLGAAAHCHGDDNDSTVTNGCEAKSLPLGTPIRIRGTNGKDYKGTLAYSSWRTMGNPEKTDTSICEYNDFSLIKIHAPHSIVHPSVLHYGGPTALCGDERVNGEAAISYGNSGLRFGVSVVAPKEGVVVFSQGPHDTNADKGFWSTLVYMLTPGIPGDSGSGYMRESDKCAWGVTSTVGLFPFAASNGISNLKLALEYARQRTGRNYRLVRASEDGASTPLF